MVPTIVIRYVWYQQSRFETYPTEAQLAELEAASELTWADVAMTAGALSASVPAHGLVVYDL